MEHSHRGLLSPRPARLELEHRASRRENGLLPAPRAPRRPPAPTARGDGVLRGGRAASASLGTSLETGEREAYRRRTTVHVCVCVSVSVRVFRELRLFCPPGMLALPPGGGEGGRRGLSCTGPARRKRLTGLGVPPRARGRKGLHTRAARSGVSSQISSEESDSVWSGDSCGFSSPPFSRPRNVSTPRLSWEREPHREKSLMDFTEEFRLGIRSSREKIYF